jgi:putative hydrolase of the HAD superfamily
MATTMQSVSVITFDAGHTLIYPWPSVGEVYAEIMACHGLHRTPAAVNQAWERAWELAQARPRHPESANWEHEWWRLLVRDVVQLLAGDYQGAGFDRLFEELWATFAEPRRWRMYEPALGVLATLRDRGYRLGLLSNWDLRLRPLLQGLGLHDYFEHVIISGEVGVEKPSPRIFQHAVALFDAAPDAFLHVGDSVYHDIVGARAAGWQGVHLDLAGTSQEALRVGSLSDLLAHLPGPGKSAATPIGVTHG